MAPVTELILCIIIEKDCNGDTLWTWNYPTMIESEKNYITRKYNSQLEHNNIQSFVFTKHGQYWFYIYNNEANSKMLPKVKQFAIVLLTQDYFPQKYELLCRIFSRTYNKSGNPVEILKLYLSVYTKGYCETEEKEIFSSEDFDIQSLDFNTKVKDLIQMFELETILIYTALLLKKRIVIYHHSLEQLLMWIKTFPALMKRRKITDYLFSWVDLVPDELTELQKNAFYVAGCRDSLISSKPELYDLLVNIPAREIIVTNHAKESFTMTKTHKEIALFMVQLSENELLTESQVISEIADKTQDLLNQLISLATVETPEGEKKVPIQSIKEKSLATSVENFLINLAIAENLLIM